MQVLLASVLGLAIGWFVSHIAEALLVRAFGSAEAREQFTNCLESSDCSERLLSFIPISTPGKLAFAIVLAAFIALGFRSRRRYLAKLAASKSATGAA